MKNKLFPIFITLLGLFTAYFFYAIWHSDELQESPEPTTQEKKEEVDIGKKKVIPKNNYIFQNIEPPKPPQILDTPRNVVFKSPKKIEEENQEVYESLMPEEHHQFMSQAEAAFESLDEEVARLKEKYEQ